MKRAAYRRFLYRVLVIDKEGKEGNFLAEVKSDLDENARRRIISAELAGESRVKTIMPTHDRTKQPGDLQKRCYT